MKAFWRKIADEVLKCEIQKSKVVSKFNCTIWARDLTKMFSGLEINFVTLLPADCSLKSSSDCRLNGVSL